MSELTASFARNCLSPWADEPACDVSPASLQLIDSIGAGRDAGGIHPEELAKDLASVHGQDSKPTAQLPGEVCRGLSKRADLSFEEKLALFMILFVEVKTGKSA